MAACGQGAAGHHLAPVLLSSGANTFNSLGEWFTLLAFGASDGDVFEFERAASRLGIPTKVIRDSRDNGREAYEAP